MNKSEQWNLPKTIDELNTLSTVLRKLRENDPENELYEYMVVAIDNAHGHLMQFDVVIHMACNAQNDWELEQATAIGGAQ